MSEIRQRTTKDAKEANPESADSNVSLIHALFIYKRALRFNYTVITGTLVASCIVTLDNDQKWIKSRFSASKRDLSRFYYVY